MVLKSARSLKTILAASAAISVISMPAFAQPTASEGENLDVVLNQFATEANIEILFSSDITKDLIVVPEMLEEEAPRESLEKILSGTGLTFEEPSNGVFIIKKADLMPSIAPKSQNRAPMSQLPKAKISKTAQLQSESSETRAVVETTVTDSIDLQAAPGVISGQVIDQFSGQPLAGATVLIPGVGRTVATDIRGFYRFPTAPAGEYDVSVNYLGAQFRSQRAVVRSGESVRLDFSLANELDEMVVYGKRSSLQQSLNQQRSAANNQTIVAADLLGSFPAETISEALRRVPGVSFARDAATGEGDRISIRGFNASAINVQLNGLDLQGTGIDRSIDLSGFLTDNIKQVTIQKSLLPSQEATGSGGLVEIETRSGLDYGEKYFSIGSEFERPFANGFGDEFELSGTGAYQLSEDFGVSATVQYRKTEGQNYETNPLFVEEQVLPDGFTSAFRLPETFNYPFDAAIDTPLYTGANYFSRGRDEENLTMSLNFAYDWADHTRLRLDLQRIDNDTEFSESRATLGFLSSSTDMPIPQLNDEVRRRTYLRSLRPTLGITDRSEDLRSTTVSFRGETDVKNWEFDYTVGLTKIERNRLSNSASFLTNQNSNIAGLVDPTTAIFNPDDNAAMTQRLVGGAIGFAENGAPLLSLTSDGNDFISDPSIYYATFASSADAVDETETFVLEADARRYFNNSPLEYIEVGAKYEPRNRNNSDDLLSTTNLTSTLQYIRISPLNTFIDQLNPTGFGLGDLSDIGLSGANIPFVTPGTAQGFLDAISNFVVDDPATAENEARFRLTDRTNVSAVDDAGAKSPSEIKENIFAAWMQSEVNFGDFEIVGGVRYQRENRTGTAISTPSIRLNQPGFRFEPRDTFIEAGLIDFIDTTNTQETWTPSVMVNYRPNEEVVVRGSYNRSTVHPGIELIVRPSQVLLDLRDSNPRATIREPNPDLQPTSVNNYELDFSYYFKDNPGLFRVGFFLKDVSDNFTQVLVADEATDSELRQRVLDTLAPLSAIDPTLLDLPADAEYFLQRPRNGEGGQIYGVEAELIRQIDFLPNDWPEFLSNFSVLGNMTYTTSDFVQLESARDENGDLFTLELDRLATNTNRWAGNASLRYEDGPFSGSVIYTYQSASASDYDEFNLNTITPSFDTLDLRLSYTLEASGNRPQITLYAEGDDMLTSADEADIRQGIGSRFGDGDVDFFFPRTLQFNGGRRFTVGARMKF